MSEIAAPDRDVIAARIAELGDCRLSQITPAPPTERISDCPFAIAGHRTIASGRGGTGKSTLFYQLAAACSSGNHRQGAAGDPYGEYSDLPGNVLILTDEPQSRVAQRMARFERPVPWTDITTGNWGVEREIDPDRIRVLPIPDIAGPAMLHEMLDMWSVALLIIDPLRRLCKPEREGFDEVWDVVEQWLPMSLTCAVVGLHHSHREKERVQSDSVTRGFGSTAWFDSLDLVLDWDRLSEGSRTRRIKCGKSRVDDIRHGDKLWLEWNDENTYGYGPGDERNASKAAKLKPAKVDGLAERVRKYLDAHPAATKAATARAIGLDPKRRHSASYRQMVEAFDSAKATCTESHAA